MRQNHNLQGETTEKSNQRPFGNKKETCAEVGM